jgi:hypothetical protein
MGAPPVVQVHSPDDRCPQGRQSAFTCL